MDTSCNGPNFNPKLKGGKMIPIYKCSSCGWKGVPDQEDIGFGYTEAWGIPHQDKRIVPVCEKCGRELGEDEKVSEEPH